jgi:hypothetical protein
MDWGWDEEAWERDQQAAVDEAAVEFASVLRRAGFERGRDYKRLKACSYVQAIYVGPIESGTAAWSLVALALAYAPAGFENIGLDAFNEGGSGRYVHWLILAKYDGTLLEIIEPSAFCWCPDNPARQ